jgi:secreted trypsin-like serine protease
MLRKIFFVCIVLVLAFVMVGPARAISYGEYDGDSHPNVGSMVAKVGAEYYQWCSGTLIAPQVFLTASHCTAPVDSFLAANPGSEMLVTFDSQISSSSTYYTGKWVTNEAYLEARGADDPGDVAVILLDLVPTGIIPAQLPTAGLLDQLKDQHVLNDTLFTAVGYGTVRDTKQKAWQSLLDNTFRNQVNQEFLSLTDAWINLSMNLATGNGGTCYGDSGGPHFIHLNGIETNIVAAITVTGDAQCKATDKDYRMDSESARSFLVKYVTVP